MNNEKKLSTCDICEQIAAPILEEMGLYLWDIKFEKEGSEWFLRYFIDKDGGLSIDECETFSRRIDPILDEKDPISQSYYLEVSSPGMERELTREWHFEACMGENVIIRLIRPRDGVREFIGKLAKYENGKITIVCDEQEVSFEKSETAFVRIYDDYFNGGNK